MSEEIFSRPVKVEPLPREGLTVTIEANAKERAALAKLDDLADLAKFTATFSIKKSGKGVRAVGALHAEATQICVVSLEPFDVTIDEPVDVRFEAARAPQAAAKGQAEIGDLEAEDAPDPIIEGKIDVGALAAEFLALSLDPYPRKPGVEFEAPAADEAAGSSAGGRADHRDKNGS